MIFTFHLVGLERVELSSTGYEPDASTDMLKALIFSITSRLVVVKEFFKISKQVYHHSFLAAKKHYFFGYAFGGRNIVGHLHFSIQLEHETLVETQGICDSILVVFEIQLSRQYIISNAGQSHATGASKVEPPGWQGCVHRHTIGLGQELDELLSQ